jgi:GT2 family glycosyltransferase
MKISIVIPTMYRKELVMECLRRIHSTTILLNIEYIFVVDEDIESAKMLIEYGQDNSLNGHVLFRTKRMGRHKAWNDGMRLSTGDYFVHMGDDGMVQGDWLNIAREAHRDKLGGYGMVAFNDLNLDGNTQVGTHVLFDRKFCKDVLGGVMLVPHYKSFCPDLEFNERAKRAGKYYWCQNAIIEHMHSSNGKREISLYENDKVVDWEYDQNLYQQRLASGFPDDFEPVI